MVERAEPWREGQASLPSGRRLSGQAVTEDGLPLPCTQPPRSVPSPLAPPPPPLSAFRRFKWILLSQSL